MSQVVSIVLRKASLLPLLLRLPFFARLTAVEMKLLKKFKFIACM